MGGRCRSSGVSDCGVSPTDALILQPSPPANDTSLPLYLQLLLASFCLPVILFLLRSASFLYPLFFTVFTGPVALSAFKPDVRLWLFLCERLIHHT